MSTKKSISKKNSKKEPKLKIYCGIENPIPKGYKLGSMQECFNAGKVMYYGIKKVDSLLLKSKAKNDDNKKDLQIKAAGLKGKMSKLKKDLDKVKSIDEKQKIINEFEETKKELLSIAEKIKKIIK